MTEMGGVDSGLRRNDGMGGGGAGWELFHDAEGGGDVFAAEFAGR